VRDFREFVLLRLLSLLAFQVGALNHWHRFSWADQRNPKSRESETKMPKIWSESLAKPRSKHKRYSLEVCSHWIRQTQTLGFYSLSFSRRRFWQRAPCIISICFLLPNDNIHTMERRTISPLAIKPVLNRLHKSLHRKKPVITKSANGSTHGWGANLEHFAGLWMISTGMERKFENWPRKQWCMN